MSKDSEYIIDLVATFVSADVNELDKFEIAKDCEEQSRIAVAVAERLRDQHGQAAADELKEKMRIIVEDPEQVYG